MIYDVCVIGGGASGLIAAIVAARRGLSVIILEKNKILGRKILSTGNGRCNFTNRFMNANCYDCSEPAFVDSIIGRFGCMEIIKFFNDIGIIPKYNSDLVYPMTNQAATVVAVLEKELNRLEVACELSFDVKTLDKADDVFVINDSIRARKVIAAFGGKASPALGTDGSCNKLLRKLGHTVSYTYPALVGLKSNNPVLIDLAGLRCIGAVTLYIDDKKICREEGEIQFNKDGISGFPVMQLSGKASRALSEHNVTVHIDFVPFLTDEQLDEYLDIHKDLTGILPQQVLGLNLDAVKARNLIIEINDTYGFNQAQVTAGGVDVSEVSPLDMSSKKCDGLYLCGELLDVDGRCGGYNLSFAFATGYLAGISI